MLSLLLIANGCWSVHVPAVPPTQVEGSVALAVELSAAHARTGAVIRPFPGQEQLGLQQSQ
jgi:hypothetical protein